MAADLALPDTDAGEDTFSVCERVPDAPEAAALADVTVFLRFSLLPFDFDKLKKKNKVTKRIGKLVQLEEEIVVVVVVI